MPVCFLRLVNVWWGGFGRFIWKELPSWTMIERWSELRVVRVCHSESKALWEETFMRSGEVGSLWEESKLRRRRSEFVRDSLIRLHVASASVLAGLWAFKSPMMMLSRKLKRRWKLGVKWYSTEGLKGTTSFFTLFFYKKKKHFH